MHIMHVALGGCMKPPPIRYGLTADTGGHIACVLGAAAGQAACAARHRVTIVTRAFDEPARGDEHGRSRQRVELSGFTFEGRRGHSWDAERCWVEACVQEGRLRVRPVR